MSRVAQFNAQWESFLNTVEARARAHFKNRGGCDLDTVNAIIRAEAGKWLAGAHYHAAWLQSLAREEPDVARELREALDGTGLEAFAPPERPTPAPHIAAGVACVTLVALLTRWLEVTSTAQFLAACASVLMIAPFLATLWARRKKMTLDAAMGRLRSRLAARGKSLSDIVSRAEGGRPRPAGERLDAPQLL